MVPDQDLIVAGCWSKFLLKSGSVKHQGCHLENRGHALLQGLVKAVGVSNYGPRQLEKIHTYLTERGVPLASAQV